MADDSLDIDCSIVGLVGTAISNSHTRRDRTRALLHNMCLYGTVAGSVCQKHDNNGEAARMNYYSLETLIFNIVQSKIIDNKKIAVA